MHEFFLLNLVNTYGFMRMKIFLQQKYYFGCTSKCILLLNKHSFELMSLSVIFSFLTLFWIPKV